MAAEEGEQVTEEKPQADETNDSPVEAPKKEKKKKFVKKGEAEGANYQVKAGSKTLVYKVKGGEAEDAYQDEEEEEVIRRKNSDDENSELLRQAAT